MGNRDKLWIVLVYVLVAAGVVYLVKDVPPPHVTKVPPPAFSATPAPVVVDEGSEDAGPDQLPRMCQPWKPSPPTRLLLRSEIPAPWLGENMDRMRCWGTGPNDPNIECESFGASNAMAFDRTLWNYSVALGFTAPNGGGFSCGDERPLTRDRVRCEARINDDSGDTIEHVTFECRGDALCEVTQASCCRVVSRRKVHEPQKPLTPQDFERSRRETCERLAERHAACLVWCTDYRYAARCRGSGWDLVCDADGGEP
jgi:hypothetical protein